MATVRGTPAEWDHFYKTGVATLASDAAASAPIAPQKEPPASGDTRQTVEVVLSEKEAANWGGLCLMRPCHPHEQARSLAHMGSGLKPDARASRLGYA